MEFLTRNLAEVDRALRIAVTTTYAAFYFGLYIIGPYSDLAFYVASYYYLTGILGFSPLYHLLKIRTRKKPKEPPIIG